MRLIPSAKARCTLSRQTSMVAAGSSLRGASHPCGKRIPPSVMTLSAFWVRPKRRYCMGARSPRLSSDTSWDIRARVLARTSAFAKGSGREAFQERAGFGLSVGAIGAICKRFERAARFLIAPETHQAERAIVAGLGRKLAAGRSAEVGVPGGQRTRWITIDEVRCVRNAVQAQRRIWPFRA